MEGNRIFNHSFELVSSEAGLLHGWQDAGYGDERTAVVCSTEHPSSGVRSVKIINPIFMATAVGIMQTRECSIQVKPGERWEASACMKSDRPGKNLRIMIHFWDEAGRWVGWHHLKFISAGTEMSRYAGLVDIPEGVSSVTLQVGMHDTGVLWIDDVAFVKVSRVEIGVLDEPSKQSRRREPCKRSIAVDGRSLLDRPGGIGKYTHNLVTHLASLDTETQYYLLRADPPPYGFPEHPNVLFAYSGGCRDDLWESHLLAQFLLKHGTALFHNTRGGLATFKETPFCRYVVTLHHLVPLKARARYPLSFVEHLETNLPVYLRGAAAIIAASNRVKEDVMMMFDIPEERLRVIYGGVAGHYRPLPEKEVHKWLRDRFSLSQDYLLFVGSFSFHNNLLGLVKAYATLPKSVQETYSLVLVGRRTNHTYEILEVARQLNVHERLVITGHVTERELPYLYNGATAFIYPSMYEGLGLPLLEAMACGTPVIASGRSSPPEIVGNAALLVNPDETEELRDAIITLLTRCDLQKELAERGLKRSSRFSWEKCAKETLEVYRQVEDSR